MITRHKNFTMTRGDDYIFAVRFNGFNADRTVESMFFTCSSNLLSDSLEFWQSLGDGITPSDDPNEHVYFVKIDHEDTKAMLPGVYYYDLQVTIDGEVYTVLAGDLILKADVTPNNSEDFYRVEAEEGVDPTEYFAALEVTDSESFFYIAGSEYYEIGYKMAAAYKSKYNYVKGEFTKYGGKLYAAKENINNSPANFNVDQWDSLEELKDG